MKNAVFFVVNEKFADAAFVQAARISALFKIDTHIFLESDAGQNIDISGYKNIPTQVFHHQNVLADVLPEKLPTTEKWPVIVYKRIFAPHFLKKYDRVIYLDADIFVADLPDQIWSISLPSGLGAVQDSGLLGQYLPGSDVEIAPWLHSIGIDQSRYFNSGMMVIDVEMWMKKDFFSLLSNFMNHYGAFVKIVDQDFLNHLFQDQWTELSPRWNFQSILFGYGFEQTFAPCIYHFTNAQKPWNLTTSPYHQSYNLMFVDAFRNVGIELEASQLRRPSIKSWFHSAKQSSRSLLSRLNIPSRRERKKAAQRSQWLSIFVSFYGNALKNNQFADIKDVNLQRGQVDLSFDGRNFISPLYKQD